MKAKVILLGLFIGLAIAIQTMAQRNPFADLRYDSALAYNFALRSRPVVSILNRDSTLHSTTVLPGKRLSIQQIEVLLHTLNDKDTYGGPPMACFEPRNAIVFYQNSKVVALIHICFACNNLRSNPEIPAQTYYFEKKNRTVSNYGFSERGAQSLKSFFVAAELRISDQ